MSANVVVPEVGESIVDARVARWLKKEGDAVSAGEPLVELETDKIDLEVSAPQAGVLGRIAHGDGADVKVGEVLGVIEEPVAGSGKPEAGSGKPEAGSGKPEAGSGKPEAGSGKLEAESRQRATPAARNAAQQNDVDLNKVQGSGDAGRVMKKDVEKAAKPQPPLREERRVNGDGRATGAGAPLPRNDERVRMSKRRATIAKRLVEVQSTAAMLTTFNEVDMSAIQAVRERHKQAFKERHGVGLGLTSFFVKAVVGALREFPRLNAEIQGDEMVLKHYFDIGVAVGASEGLVVPVLRDADHLSFAQIEQKVRAFAAAAEDGTLSLADIQGGTFTITNGGVFGSLLSTPILNPPQVGILGLHAIKDRPVAVNGQVVIRPMMYTALTYDHRIVDGAEAVQFLVRVKQLVEDPGALLLE
jgi:2-oxoglutarate dehydrogenase E2 component (dihydrolipoamide succinyltransferase)